MSIAYYNEYDKHHDAEYMGVFSHRGWFVGNFPFRSIFL